MVKKMKRTARNTDSSKVEKIKVCFFCENRKTPTYTDTVSLKKCTSGRGKIVPKSRSGVCSKHQRALAREVKRARFLALLPFTLKV